MSPKLFATTRFLANFEFDSFLFLVFWKLHGQIYFYGPMEI
jgi:hypothetical protein